jgi:hypothetical protein
MPPHPPAILLGGFRRRQSSLRLLLPENTLEGIFGQLCYGTLLVTYNAAQIILKTSVYIDTLALSELLQLVTQPIALQFRLFQLTVLFLHSLNLLTLCEVTKVHMAG